jgi:hypothetical protein
VKTVIMYRPAIEGGNLEMPADAPVPSGYVQILPLVICSARRARAWLVGDRPLPGTPEGNWRWFYESQGLAAAEVEQRIAAHRAATRREESGDCPTCNGRPPAGFACRACGAEA